MAAVYERNGEWVAVPKPTPLRLVVRAALLNALAYTDGHQGQAADLLDLSIRQFGYALRSHGIPGHAIGRKQPTRRAGRPTGRRLPRRPVRGPAVVATRLKAS